jgi:predicted dehydrogenase
MALELGRKSLAGKARARPDLVKKVLEKLSRDGAAATARAVFAKLGVPNPLGYSAAGVVLDADDAPFVPGERVAIAGARLANHAEANAVPRNLCARIPVGVTDEEASFATLGAIALHGVRLAGVQLGERVAVVGLGLVGLLAMQLLRAQGCRVLGVEPDERRRTLASALGCDAVAPPGAEAVEAMASLSRGLGADAVLLCAATDSDGPVELAGELARDRAKVVAVGAVGTRLPRRPYFDKELVFLQSRSYGPGRYDPTYEERGVDYPVGHVRWTEQRNLESFLEAVASRRVSVTPLVTHRFHIERAEEAYRLITGETGEPFLGVVLTYAGACAAETSVVVEDRAPPASSEPGVALVGAGAFMSGTLGPALAKTRGVRLVSVSSARGASARHLAETLGAAVTTTDVASQLADPSVAAVVIGTRHHLHAAQTVQALEAGKHVFVEKPLAITRDQLAGVELAHARGGRVLMAGFNRRFAPLVTELKQRLGSRGPLAMQYRVNAGTLPAGSWIRDPEVGGGRIVGEACHFVDLMSHLCGALPVRVFAERVGAGEEDVAATLRFTDGSVGTLVYTAEGDPSAPKESLEVLGGGAVARLDDFRALALSRGGKKHRSTTLWPDKGHAACIGAFVEAVRSGGPSPIPFESLVATTRATFALRESLAVGLPVDVT